MKAVFEIGGTVPDILQIITDQPNYRSIYDPGFHSGRMISQLDEFTWVFYQRVKKVAFIAGRDFMIALHFHFAPEENKGRGVMYFVGFSDPSLEDLVPAVQDIVRGDMPIAGWILEDITEDPSFPRARIT